MVTFSPQHESLKTLDTGTDTNHHTIELAYRIVWSKHNLLRQSCLANIRIHLVCFSCLSFNADIYLLSGMGKDCSGVMQFNPPLWYQHHHYTFNGARSKTTVAEMLLLWFRVLHSCPDALKFLWLALYSGGRSRCSGFSFPELKESVRMLLMANSTRR